MSKINPRSKPQVQGSRENRKRKIENPKELRTADGQFAIGNEFWDFRHKDGRNRKFESPIDLWNAACEYFRWCKDNPLMKEEGFAFQGVVTHEEFKLMRAMTLKGLAIYLGVSSIFFDQLESQFKGKDDELSSDFLSIITRIREVIYSQKFEGAAAGLLNANIIARELGLSDSQNMNVTQNFPSVIEHRYIQTGPEIMSNEDDLKKREGIK